MSIPTLIPDYRIYRFHISFAKAEKRILRILPLLCTHGSFRLAAINFQVEVKFWNTYILNQKEPPSHDGVLTILQALHPSKIFHCQLQWYPQYNSSRFLPCKSPTFPARMRWGLGLSKFLSAGDLFCSQHPLEGYLLLFGPAIHAHDGQYSRGVIVQVINPWESFLSFIAHHILDYINQTGRKQSLNCGNNWKPLPAASSVH